MNKKVLFVMTIELLSTVMFTTIQFSIQKVYGIIDPFKYNITNNLINISFIAYIMIPIIFSIYYRDKRIIGIIWIIWITLLCLSDFSIYLVTI